MAYNQNYLAHFSPSLDTPLIKLALAKAIFKQACRMIASRLIS